MKARVISLGFAALISLPFLGCSSADSGDPSPTGGEGSDIADLDGKADGVSKPVGTYQLSKPSTMGSKDLTLLVLTTDKLFHSEQQVMCVTYPCDPIGTDGTFKFTKSTTSSKRYIKLDDGATTVRYEYKLTSSGKLSLRVAGTSPWFEMVKAQTAWCGEPADCGAQNLPQPKCPGHWQCESNSCSYSECSVPKNACEAAGGSCVGLYPGNCADGEIGSATEYSCGGPVGVMCCLPKAPAPECQTDADCRLEADYCHGCDCRALSENESVPACDGPGVKCFADPCGFKTAACVSGQCVAK
ncbi:MAG: hypothetical protein IPI67_36655 [Myxococcales bacterium]|nr:hypothetical protein [Myxococcales bacterium]